MLSRFFLERPVFAWVIAIILMVAGCLAIYNLPIAQHPPIAPPSIRVLAFYPGASAETVENSVTQIIEQKMTGLDKMIYMSATSDSAGSSTIELTFAPGTDPDIAWTKVQNKLQLAMASLPDVVQRTGITVGKATKNYLLMVGLISEDGSMSAIDVRDYAQSNLEKVLARVPGVGEVEVFGFQYAMRIWLLPDHYTVCRTGRHLPDAVPYALCGPGIAPDHDLLAYSETAIAEASRLKAVRKSYQFMPELLQS